MPVNREHPDDTTSPPAWDRTRVVIAGGEAVKLRVTLCLLWLDAQSDDELRDAKPGSRQRQASPHFSISKPVKSFFENSLSASGSMWRRVAACDSCGFLRPEKLCKTPCINPARNRNPGPDLLAGNPSNYYCVNFCVLLAGKRHLLSAAGRQRETARRGKYESVYKCGCGKSETGMKNKII